VSGIWFLMDCEQGISCGPYNAEGKKATRCHKEDRALDGPPLLGDNCVYEEGTRRVAAADPGRCKKVVPTAEYRAAVNDYIANGGSGFVVLKRNTTKFNTGISLRDSLIDYVREITNRCSPKDNSNIVYDAQDITEAARACTRCEMAEDPRWPGAKLSAGRCTDAAAQKIVDGECGAGHVCPTGRCFRHYDWSELPCLDFSIQAHDGRIDHNR
jgi:hypothetical protein